MRIDRYEPDEKGVMQPDPQGTYVPFVQVSRLMGSFTTRDRMAAAALTGLVSFPGKHEGRDEDTARDFARMAYEIADAMMDERSKR